MQFGNFVRECYLRSVPSVDLDALKTNEKIKCSDYKLTVSEYENILDEFDVKENSDEALACNMFMLQSGPQLVDDRTA